MNCQEELTDKLKPEEQKSIKDFINFIALSVGGDNIAKIKDHAVPYCLIMNCPNYVPYGDGNYCVRGKQ